MSAKKKRVKGQRELNEEDLQIACCTKRAFGRGVAQWKKGCLPLDHQYKAIFKKAGFECFEMYSPQKSNRDTLALRKDAFLVVLMEASRHL